MNAEILVEGLTKWLDAQTITAKNMESVRYALTLPFECEWNELVRRETEARKDLVAFRIPQSKLDEITSKAYQGLLANGGKVHLDIRLCECDLSVNLSPCRYCAIYEAITAPLKILGVTVKKIE